MSVASTRPDPLQAVWPPPLRAERRAGSLARGELAWCVAAEFEPAFERELRSARAAFERAWRSTAATGKAPIAVERANELAPQGYALRVAADGVRIAARDAAGVRHALATLAQLSRAADGPLPALAIDDAPAFAERGVMLDVSRTRVPTVATLEGLVERLAALKVNRLQLYFEHTFAYNGHEEVWRESSAYTPDELRALDRHCAAHGIELVPNQQSFGHMHRWLVHDRYRPLAEVPEGVEHAFSIHKEPYALCPLDERTFALLEDLYDQLLPCVASRTLNVGLDETFDLGLGRSKAACEARGKHHVYLDFVRRVHALLAARGRRMQFWGDIVLEAPEIVPELPRDVVPMLWNYEAAPTFDRDARVFAEHGFEYHVCPGTASWQSLLGRVDVMRANVLEAARAGAAHGARGLLVTDWGDRGHHQPWSVSWPGLVTAAGAAWNPAAAAQRLAEEDELAELLDRHVFDAPGAGTGAALLALGRAGDASGAVSTNGLPLFFLLAFAPKGWPNPRVKELTEEGLARAERHLADARAALARSTPASADARSVLDELDWAARVAQFAARFGAARLAAPEGALAALSRLERAALASELDERIAEYGAVWHARHRPGGFGESRAWLERARALLG
ncbi:MAG: family 20 glycosylhydrolase [Planctomycetes bacterium]|nr:family 20 glycosylhydrolase [Planctomycetota bacterium]